MAVQTTQAGAMAAPWRHFGITTLIALGAGVATNTLVYLSAAALGSMPQEVVVRPGQPITLTAVIGTTVVSILAAAGLLVGLRRWTRRAYPVFRRVALVVLVLSLATPFAVPGAPVGMIVALELMHVLTAGITVGALTYRRR